MGAAWALSFVLCHAVIVLTNAALPFRLFPGSWQKASGAPADAHLARALIDLDVGLLESAVAALGDAKEVAPHFEEDDNNETESITRHVLAEAEISYAIGDVAAATAVFEKALHERSIQLECGRGHGLHDERDNSAGAEPFDVESSSSSSLPSLPPGGGLSNNASSTSTSLSTQSASGLSLAPTSSWDACEGKSNRWAALLSFRTGSRGRGSTSLSNSTSTNLTAAAPIPRQQQQHLSGAALLSLLANAAEFDRRMGRYSSAEGKLRDVAALLTLCKEKEKGKEKERRAQTALNATEDDDSACPILCASSSDSLASSSSCLHAWLLLQSRLIASERQSVVGGLTLLSERNIDAVAERRGEQSSNCTETASLLLRVVHLLETGQGSAAESVWRVEVLPRDKALFASTSTSSNNNNNTTQQSSRSNNATTLIPHPYLAASLHTHGLLVAWAGDALKGFRIQREARTMLSESLSFLPKEVMEATTLFVRSLYASGEALLALGQPRRAARYFSRAYESGKAGLGPHHPLTATCGALLAIAEEDAATKLASISCEGSSPDAIIGQSVCLEKVAGVASLASLPFYRAALESWRGVAPSERTGNIDWHAFAKRAALVDARASLASAPKSFSPSMLHASIFSAVVNASKASSSWGGGGVSTDTSASHLPFPSSLAESTTGASLFAAFAIASARAYMSENDFAGAMNVVRHALPIAAGALLRDVSSLALSRRGGGGAGAGGMTAHGVRPRTAQQLPPLPAPEDLDKSRNVSTPAPFLPAVMRDKDGNEVEVEGGDGGGAGSGGGDGGAQGRANAYTSLLAALASAAGHSNGGGGPILFPATADLDATHVPLRVRSRARDVAALSALREVVLARAHSNLTALAAAAGGSGGGKKGSAKTPISSSIAAALPRLAEMAESAQPFTILAANEAGLLFDPHSVPALGPWYRRTGKVLPMLRAGEDGKASGMNMILREDDAAGAAAAAEKRAPRVPAGNAAGAAAAPQFPPASTAPSATATTPPYDWYSEGGKGYFSSVESARLAAENQRTAAAAAQAQAAAAVTVPRPASSTTSSSSGMVARPTPAVAAIRERAIHRISEYMLRVGMSVYGCKLADGQVGVAPSSAASTTSAPPPTALPPASTGAAGAAAAAAAAALSTVAVTCRHEPLPGAPANFAALFNPRGFEKPAQIEMLTEGGLRYLDTLLEEVVAAEASGAVWELALAMQPADIAGRPYAEVGMPVVVVVGHGGASPAVAAPAVPAADAQAGEKKKKKKKKNADGSKAKEEPASPAAAPASAPSTATSSWPPHSVAALVPSAQLDPVIEWATQTYGFDPTVLRSMTPQELFAKVGIVPPPAGGGAGGGR